MDELVYRIALSMMPLSVHHQHQILEEVGSATLLCSNLDDLESLLPECNKETYTQLRSIVDYYDRAKREIEFAQSKGIRLLTSLDSDYPTRLQSINDAPTILYTLGNASLQAKHAISIVGTRHCTQYGLDMCRLLVDELATLVPDIVIFSGMAYGIDICAHRACLDNGLATVGVFAHGLDSVYPVSHRTEANKMVMGNGALISEYPCGAHITKSNFLARNRIIAACSDATIVVESSEKGGSLNTARMAFEYDRSVYVVPGRITDKESAGCIGLICRDIAKPITSAQQLVKSLGWSVSSNSTTAIQTELFADQTPQAEAILNLLTKGETFSLAQITQSTGLSRSEAQTELLQLEMSGLIVAIPGALYRRTFI